MIVQFHKVVLMVNLTMMITYPLLNIIVRFSNSPKILFVGRGEAITDHTSTFYTTLTDF